MQHARKTLIVAGAILLALAAAMMLIAGSMFTMSQTPNPLLMLVAQVAFWGFIPTGIVGTIVLVLGLVSRREAGGTK